MTLRIVFRGDERHRRAIGERRRCARRHRAIGAERRLQARKPLQRRSRAQRAILIDNSVNRLHRHDLIAQAALALRFSSLHLRDVGELFLIRARDVVLPRNILRRLSHRDVGVEHHVGIVLRLPLKARVGRMVEATLRHARHALDAASDESFARADGDLANGIVDGRHRRSAEAVHRDAAQLDRQPGQQGRQPRDVGALLRLRIGRAEHDILQRLRVDPRPLDQPLDGDGGEIVGPYAHEFALVGEMEWRARISCDDSPGHVVSPLSGPYI